MTFSWQVLCAGALVYVCVLLHVYLTVIRPNAFRCSLCGQHGSKVDALYKPSPQLSAWLGARPEHNPRPALCGAHS